MVRMNCQYDSSTKILTITSNDNEDQAKNVSCYHKYNPLARLGSIFGITKKMQVEERGKTYDVYVNAWSLRNIISGICHREADKVKAAFNKALSNSKNVETVVYNTAKELSMPHYMRDTEIQSTSKRSHQPYQSPEFEVEKPVKQRREKHKAIPKTDADLFEARGDRLVIERLANAQAAVMPKIERQKKDQDWDIDPKTLNKKPISLSKDQIYSLGIKFYENEKNLRNNNPNEVIKIVKVKIGGQDVYLDRESVVDLFMRLEMIKIDKSDSPYQIALKIADVRKSSFKEEDKEKIRKAVEAQGSQLGIGTQSFHDFYENVKFMRRELPPYELIFG